jgi:HlyD family secretion protein
MADHPPRNTPRSATVWPPFVVALALLAMTAGFTACHKQEAAPPVVVNVQAAPATRRQVVEHVAADAVLAPLAQAAIQPKITAPVKKFYVQRGSKVKAGQLLAVLENKDLEAAAVDNKGTYEAAEATYKTTTKAQVPEDYQKAELDLTQARANLDLNQKIVDARKQLFAQGAIPGRDLDTAQAALVQAQATYDTALKHFESMKAVSHEEALKNAQGQFDSAKGKLLGAQASLSYSEIHSPIDGVVTDRPLFAGETASPAAPLITLMDTSALLAKTHLPQSQTQSMKVGSPAEIKVPGADDPVEGKIALISPALDPGSTTVEVWVRLENPKGIYKAGTPVHLDITARVQPDALAVPSAAILSTVGGKKSVMVVGADGVAHAREVETGIEGDGNTQVVNGLTAGDRVIISGGYALDDGTKVNIVSAEEMEKEKGGDAEKPGKSGGTD